MSAYTANLAAYIAGKHAGINYNDLHDPRVSYLNYIEEHIPLSVAVINIEYHTYE
jgi:hypothetical protein